MVVRELVTRIRFALDKMGINRANNATNKIKSTLDDVGNKGQQAGDKIASGMDNAAKAAEIFEAHMRRIGAYQDKRGRWHGADGKYVTTAMLAQIQESLGVVPVTAKKAVSWLSELKPIGALVSGIYMAVGNTIVNAMQRAISKTIEAGTEMQRLDGKLRQVTNGDKHRAEIKDKLFDVAQRSRSDISSVGDLYYKTSRAKAQTGLNDQENLDLTETVGKALTVGGASTGEKNATILQLSQALGSGVLQGDELRSLNENASGLMNEVAKYFGTTVGGLRDLGRDGKLTSKEVAKAILSAKKTIDEQYKKIPLTIGDSMTMIGNIFKKGMSALEDNTHILSKIAKALLMPFQALESGFSKLSKRMGGSANVIRLMTVLLGSLGVAIAAVNFNKIATGLSTVTKAIRGFAIANASAFSVLMLIAAVVAIVALAIEDLYTWMNGGESLIGDFLGPFDKFKEAHPWVQTLIDTLILLWQKLSDIGGILNAVGQFLFDTLGCCIMLGRAFIELVVSLIELGTSIIQIFSGIDLTPILSALQRLFMVLLPVGIGFFKLLWAIITLPFEAVAFVIAVVIKIFAWLIGLVAEFMSSGSLAASVIQAAFQTMCDVLAGIFNLLTGIFTGNWEMAIASVLGLFQRLYNGSLKILQDIANAIGKYIGDKVKEAKQWISDLLGWKDEATSQAVKDAQQARVEINQTINGSASVQTTNVSAQGMAVEYADGI